MSPSLNSLFTHVFSLHLTFFVFDCQQNTLLEASPSSTTIFHQKSHHQSCQFHFILTWSSTRRTHWSWCLRCRRRRSRWRGPSAPPQSASTQKFSSPWQWHLGWYCINLHRFETKNCQLHVGWYCIPVCLSAYRFKTNLKNLHKNCDALDNHLQTYTNTWPSSSEPMDPPPSLRKIIDPLYLFYHFEPVLSFWICFIIFHLFYNFAPVKKNLPVKKGEDLSKVMQLGSWQLFGNFSDGKLTNSGLQSTI